MLYRGFACECQVNKKYRLTFISRLHLCAMRLLCCTCSVYVLFCGDQKKTFRVFRYFATMYCYFSLFASASSASFLYRGTHPLLNRATFSFEEYRSRVLQLFQFCFNSALKQFTNYAVQPSQLVIFGIYISLFDYFIFLKWRNSL